MSWRHADGFFNIKMEGNKEPEITTLVLKHGKSILNFNFAEESDGTKLVFTTHEDTIMDQEFFRRGMALFLCLSSFPSEML